MDSKLTTIIFIVLLFLSGAFFVSKSLLHRPTSQVAVMPATAASGISLTPEVRDYIESHCNQKKTEDAALTAKFAELESKIDELKQMAAQSKEIDAKIDAFKEEVKKFLGTRRKVIAKQKAVAFEELQNSVVDACRPNSGKKSSGGEGSSSGSDSE